MEVSKLTMSDKLKRQTSTQHQILRWMQEHPRLCTNTNATRMSKLMHGVQGTAETKQQTIIKMVNTRILARFGTKFNARFLINYLHKDIPEDILARAPEEERKQVERIKEGLKATQELDREGCIVPKAETKKEKEMPKIEAPQVDAKVDKNNLTITININLG